MSRFTESYRRLAALSAIDSGGKVTQRALAARLDISLGLANGVLRRLRADKLIRISNGENGRYVVTRKGRVEMKRLSMICASEADLILSGLREELRRSATRLRGLKRKAALLCGDGPVAELAAATLRNEGMRVAGVVAAAPADERLAGLRVRPIQDAAKIRHDASLAMTASDAQALRRVLGPRARIQQIIPGR